MNLKNIDIKCVFAPEHGFRGKADAGELIKQSNQTLKEILDSSMDDIEEVIKLEGKLNKKINEIYNKFEKSLNINTLDLEDAYLLSSIFSNLTIKDAEYILDNIPKSGFSDLTTMFALAFI